MNPWKQTKLILLLVTLTFSSNILARTWERIYIPGAVCGSGLPYSVFLSKENKDQKKLAIEFMGGGACWSLASCYGTKLSTWMFPIPKVPLYSVLSSENPAYSPVADHTMLYLPYCTGDTFAGEHTATYALGIKAHFQGATNIKRALAFLIGKGYLGPQKIEELFVAGSSAGAIGSLFHINLLTTSFPKAHKRTMLVDSPGLHWNENFWRKFSGNMLVDFANAFKRAGLFFDVANGMVATQMNEYCQKYSQWDIGFLQASRDSAMSTWFGGISADEFERNVFSQGGILASTADAINCSAWVQQSSTHMFYLSPRASASRSQGISAIDFAFQISRGQTENNYGAR